MPVQTILSAPFVQQIVLPFLLVFAVAFAILEKTKILGDGKRQIDAIVAFVLGLVFVSFSSAVSLTTNLLGVTAVIVVILLAFMLLYGFVSADKEKGFVMPGYMQTAFLILIILALLIAILYFTGYWDKIVNSVSSGSGLVTEIIFIVVIIAAMIIVLVSGKKE